MQVSKNTGHPGLPQVARWASVSLAIVALLLCVPLPLVWTQQVILGALLVAASIFIGRFSRGRSATLMLTFVSLFCTLRYFYWRWTNTLRYLNDNAWKVDPWSLFFAFVLLGAETYAVIVLILGFFQSARPLQRRPAPLPENTDEWPSVDVFIPTYNEPLEVVRPTVLAALGIDWPADRLRVYILDDGRRPKFQSFAEECGAEYITRFDNKHAKAGNINNALSKTSGEYIAIFDCDHIATRSFLQMTMGWFLKDRRLALMQTPHHFYSPDPFERNLHVFRKVPNEGALFYGLIQQGNDLWNASFFCGSCAVIRRKALEEIGGIAVETVTEDAHTSLRMQRRGWGTAFIAIPQAAGLATGSLAAHIGQRIRWARGMVQILRIECPLFATGLSFAQRLCYLNSVIYYLYGLPHLVFLTAPLVYLILGKNNLYGYVWEILAYAVPHLILATIANSRVKGKYRYSFWNEVYDAVLAPYIVLPALLALINPKWGKFNVTSKSSIIEERFFDFKIARPYLFLLALNVIGITMAVFRFHASGDPSHVLAVNMFWVTLNTLLVGTSLAVCVEDQQRRSNVRIAANMPVCLSLSSGRAYDCRLVDISEGGVALRSDQNIELRPGIMAEVLIRTAKGDQRFPVQVIEAARNTLRLQFISGDLEQQRALTHIVYSRADAWLNWTEGQSEDRILRSLFQVIGVGMRGLLAVPIALINHRRQEKQSAKLAEIGQTIAPLVLFALLFLSAFSVRAFAVGIENPHPAVQTRTAATELSFHEKQNLVSEALTLRGAEGQSVLRFGISSTKIVSDASLTIRYRASYQALTPGSNLEVSLNGSSIGTVALTESQSDPGGLFTSRLALPADLFIDDNTLTFHLHVQCTSPCSDAGKAEPWLRIENETQLDISGSVLPLPNRLSLLPAPFFDASFQHTLQLPVAFAAQPDRQTLQAAGIVASWYGVMADFRGTHFPVSVGQIPPGNAVLFATSGSSLLANMEVSAAGPVIAIRRNPSDPSGKVLVITGKSGEEILTAARALALGQFSRDGDQAEITTFNMPAPSAAYDAPRWLAAGSSTKIAQDSSSDFLNASNGNPATLYFRLAPDLYFGSRTTVPFRLVYKVSGIQGETKARIQLNLNGMLLPAREIPLQDSPNPQSQSFAIPTIALHPGNTLTVTFVPLDARGLPAIDDSAAQLQIAKTTALDLDHVSHYVRLPRVDLFASAGFPFTRFADLRQTAIVLPNSPSHGEFSLYLDSLGFLGAQTGYPAIRIQIINPVSAGYGTGKDLLIIGAGPDQPLFSRWSSFLPVQPAGASLLLNHSRPFWFDSFSQIPFLRGNQESTLADLLNGDTRPSFVLEQFPLPFGDRSSAVVLAPSSPANEDPILVMLASASKQGHVAGNLVLLNDGQFRSFRFDSRPFYVGTADWRQMFEYWMGFHVWLIPVVVIIGSLLIGQCWGLYLEKQAAKRLALGG